MSVQTVDAGGRSQSMTSAPVAPHGPALQSALRLVQVDHARLAALLGGASGAGGESGAAAFERAFPGAIGAACIGAAGIGAACVGAACTGAAAHGPLLADAVPDLPLAPVHMKRLVPQHSAGAPQATPGAGHDASCYEIWQCAADDLRSVRRGALHYRYSEAAGLVFGSIVLNEADFAAQPATHAQAPLERATDAAYRMLFDLLDGLDMPHPLRIWNTVPAINLEQHGAERYRQFNAGRQRAFEACRRTLTGSVPAACALGSVGPLSAQGVPGEPLAVYFLASRTSADAIENPRQVSAFHYPAQYGARAPTFARAAAWSGAAGACTAPVLFISGTASIVGHRTVHHGDVLAQTRETLANLAAVLDQAARQGHGPFALADLTFKVYVRDGADAAMLAAIDSQLREAAGPHVRALYLHADVCRSDLLIEIEASAGHAVASLA
ncbi:endoribonuclease L-PSP [Paraburkholderia silviterrae]|uniref:Endoribonuclease L-PSP n=1 Tax=Paraburkholderia silviterrae TaxID=2528715 RepID=A0A4R5M3I7_9BURK|nr:endoribonuclease L-PSP [Paraburkholderia silviterrae]TDG19842.1 endoribonuclease L-PSP [Paraburkholderia silviterrae]